MHSHEPGGGLPPPPTRLTVTHMHLHKPGGGLPVLTTRPAVTFPAIRRLCHDDCTQLYCFVTEAHRCEKLTQSFYAVVPSWDSNPQPLDRKSDTLPNVTTPPKRHCTWRLQTATAGPTIVSRCWKLQTSKWSVIHPSFDLCPKSDQSIVLFRRMMELQRVSLRSLSRLPQLSKLQLRVVSRRS